MGINVAGLQRKIVASGKRSVLMCDESHIFDAWFVQCESAVTAAHTHTRQDLCIVPSTRTRSYIVNSSHGGYIEQFFNLADIGYTYISNMRYELT